MTLHLTVETPVLVTLGILLILVLIVGAVCKNAPD